MITIKILLILMSMLMPCLINEAAVGQENNVSLELRLSSDKKVYQVGDRIYFELVYDNIGNKSTYLFTEKSYAIGWFEIEDKFGNKMDEFPLVLYEWQPPYKDLFFLLEPKMQFREKVEAQIGRGSEGENSFLKEIVGDKLYIGFPNIANPQLIILLGNWGTYIVRYSYQKNQKEYIEVENLSKIEPSDYKPIEAYTDLLVSNTILITIKEKK